MCGCADKHNFGFLRVELKKIDEMPVVNGICALTQIVKLFGDTVVGEDGVKARVVRVLVKRHVEVHNDGVRCRSWKAGVLGQSPGEPKQELQQRWKCDRQA